MREVFSKAWHQESQCRVFFGFRHACPPEADAMWILLGWVLSLKLIELFDSEPCLTD